MIHVVFQQADVAVMQEAMALDPSLQGPVVEIKDDFAVGPLMDLHTEEGWSARRDWWHQLIAASPYSNETGFDFDDRKTVQQLLDILVANDEEVLWIWMGQNQHDVCGYYWLIARLKKFHGRVFVLYLNNLPFINEKGQLYYPVTLHNILPREFQKAKKLCRPVTLSEFEVDPDEWTRLSQENALVRFLEGGKKIVSRETDFFDPDILANLPAEWQKGSRAMQQILSKMKIKTGDVFILWRMRLLVAADKMELNGDPAKGWKEFEVKRKGPAGETAYAGNTENNI